MGIRIDSRPAHVFKNVSRQEVIQGIGDFTRVSEVSQRTLTSLPSPRIATRKMWQEALTRGIPQDKSLVRSRDKSLFTQFKTEAKVSLFTHVHGDLWAKKTGLEGCSYQYTGKLVGSFLQQRKEGQKAVKLAAELDQLVSFQAKIDKEDISVVKDITKSIQLLKVGETLLVPSGWRGYTEGHAILCEFKKVDSSHYDITFFNTGDTDERYFYEALVHGKKKICPLQYFSQVPEDALLLDDVDSLFIRQLVKTNFAPKKAKDFKEHFYNRVLFLLRPFAKSPPQETLFFMTAQRSGTCSFRSLAAWMFSRCGKEYKLLKHELKLATLIDFFSCVKAEEFKEKERFQAINQLELAAEKFIREALKLEQKLSRDGFEQSVATAAEILSWIKEDRKKLQKQQELVISEAVLEKDESSARIAFLNQPKQGVQVKKELKSAPFPFQVPEITEENLIEELEKVTPFCRVKYSPCDKTHFAQWAYKLSTVSWEKIQDASALKKAKDAVGDLSEAFFSTVCSSDEYGSSRTGFESACEVNAALAILVVGYEIACRIDSLKPTPFGIKNCKLDISRFEWVRNRQAFSTAEEIEQTAHLLKKIDAINAEEGKLPLDSPPRECFEVDTPGTWPLEMRMWSRLLNDHPDLSALLSQECLKDLYNDETKAACAQFPPAILGSLHLYSQYSSKKMSREVLKLSQEGAIFEPLFFLKSISAVMKIGSSPTVVIQGEFAEVVKRSVFVRSDGSKVKASFFADLAYKRWCYEDKSDYYDDGFAPSIRRSHQEARRGDSRFSNVYLPPREDDARFEVESVSSSVVFKDTRIEQKSVSLALALDSSSVAFSVLRMIQDIGSNYRILTSSLVRLGLEMTMLRGVEKEGRLVNLFFEELTANSEFREGIKRFIRSNLDKTQSSLLPLQDKLNVISCLLRIGAIATKHCRESLCDQEFLEIEYVNEILASIGSEVDSVKEVEKDLQQPFNEIRILCLEWIGKGEFLPEVLASWFALKASNEPNYYGKPLSGHLVAQAIFEPLKKVGRFNEAEKHALLTQVVRRLYDKGLLSSDVMTKEEWSGAQVSVTIDSRPVTLDFLEGSIRDSSGVGIIRKCLQASISDTYNYKKILGGENLIWDQTGYIYELNHPKWGWLRCDTTGYYSTNTCKIEKQITLDGKLVWCQLCDDSLFLKGILPPGLVIKTAFFHDFRTQPSTLIGYDIFSGKEVVKVFPDGSIVETSSSDNRALKIISPKRSLAQEVTLGQLMLRVEAEGFYYEKYSKDLVMEIELPRYRGKDGKPLKFQRDKDGLLCLSDNANLYIDLNNQRKGLLGTDVESNYLILKHKKSGKQYLFLPAREVDSKPGSGFAKIDVADAMRKKTCEMEKKPYFSMPHLQLFDYFLCEIKGDGPVIQTADQGFFFALLALRCHRYLDAYDYLLKAKKISLPSKIGTIFCQSLMAPLKEKEDWHPSAAACRLKAWEIWREIQASIGKEMSANVMPLNQDKFIYKEFRSNIPAIIELKEKTEVELNLLPSGDQSTEVRIEQSVLSSHADGVSSYYVGEQLKQPVPADLGVLLKHLLGEEDQIDDKGRIALEASFIPFFNSLLELKDEKLKKKILYALASKHYDEHYTREFFKEVLIEVILHPEHFTKLQDQGYPDPEDAARAIINEFRIAIQQKDTPLFGVSYSILPEVVVERRLIEALPLQASIKSRRQPKSSVDPKRNLALSRDVVAIEEHYQGKQKMLFDFLERVPTSNASFPTIALSETYIQAFKAEGEGEYTRSIATHLQTLDLAIDAERVRREERSIYQIKRMDELESTLAKESQDVSKKIESRSSEIVAILNRQTQSLSASIEAAKKISGVSSILSIEDAYSAFLQGGIEAFRDLNPILSEGESIDLYSQVASLLVLRTHFQFYGRCIDHMRDIGACETEKERELYFEKLVSEIQLERAFSIEEDPDLLLFEAQSGLRIRKDQMKLIQEMCEESEGKYVNCVAKMIMGGGKTAVLAAILGLRAAKKDRLSVFLTTGALYESTLANLRNTQIKTFDQDVVPIDFSVVDVTYSVLEAVYDKLMMAEKESKLVVMKAETVQFIVLEYLRELSENKGTFRENYPFHVEKKLLLLEEILKLFKDKGDVIADEIDLIMQVQKTINIPLGKPEKVDIEKLDIVKKVYSYLIRDDIFVNVEGVDVSLKDLVKLTINQQHNLGSDRYLSVVLPALAKEIAKEQFLKRADLDKIKIEAYLASKIDESQEESDLEFLKQLEEMAKEGSDAADLAFANSLALTRYLLNDVLKLTLSKEGNKDYGRDHTREIGAVVPYMGAGQPATTEFGTWLEKACYHCQIALQQEITLEETKKCIEELRTRVDSIRSGYQSEFEVNEDVEFFERVTGYDFEFLKDPKAIFKIQEFLNSHPEGRLEFEILQMQKLIKIRNKKLSSSTDFLPHLFSSLRAFSATPWNKDQYQRSLAHRVYTDDTVDGKVAYEMLSEERNQKIHQLLSHAPEDVLNAVLENRGTGGPLRGIIDAGSIFKDYSNQAVAEKINSFFEQDPTVAGVLFFVKDEGRDSANSLAFMKKGSTNYVILGSTQKDSIEALGVPFENIFVYYDDRHTTGSDIFQHPTVTNLLTIGANQLWRDESQAVMRLRGFLSGQSIEYGVDLHSSEVMVGKAKTAADILANCVKNQAVLVASGMPRALKQQMVSEAKRVALHDLMESRADRAKQIELLEKYHDLLSTNDVDVQYSTVGRHLQKELLTEELTKLKQSLMAFGLSSEFEKAADLIIEESKTSEICPSEVLVSSGGQSLGTEEEIEVAVENESEKEVQREVESQQQAEIRSELSRYRNANLRGYKKPFSKSESYFEALIKQGREGADKLLSTSDQVFERLSDHVRRGVDSKKAEDYGALFTGNVYVSSNFSLFEKEGPFLFSEKALNVEHVLIVHHQGEIASYILPMEEAALCRKYLDAHPDVINATLCGPNEVRQLKDSLDREAYWGQEELTNAKKKLLLEINWFSGYAENLNKPENQNLISEFLRSKSEEIAAHYFAVKVMSKPDLLEGAYKRSWLSKLEDKALKEKLQKEKDLRKRLSELSVDELHQIDDSLIPHIPRHLIPFLSSLQVKKIQRNQVRYLSKEQVPYLPGTLVRYLRPISDLVHEVNDAFLNDLTSDQFILLRGDKLKKVTSTKLLNYLVEEQADDLDVSQIAMLPEHRLALLSKKELIQNVPIKKLSYLSESSFQKLSDKQIEGMDYVLFNRLKSKEQKRRLVEAVRVKLLSKVDFASTLQPFSGCADFYTQLLQGLEADQINALPSSLYKFFGAREIELLSDEKLLVSDYVDWIGNNDREVHAKLPDFLRNKKISLGIGLMAKRLTIGISKVMMGVLASVALVPSLLTPYFWFRNQKGVFQDGWNQLVSMQSNIQKAFKGRLRY